MELSKVRIIKLLTRETIEVNRAKKFEEADAMLGEFGKVLIYHI